MDLNRFNLVFHSGNPDPLFDNRLLYDKGYEHFRSVWERTFTRRAGAGSYDPYAFYRQNIIYTLFYGTEVAAQICSSFYQIKAAITPELGYYTNFLGKPHEFMVEKGIRFVSTGEYSSVARNYSPRKANGLHLNEVMTRIGLISGSQLGADAVLGLPRRVTGTNTVCSDLGMELLEPARERLGLVVDVFIGYKNTLKPSSDPQIEQLVNRLWRDRLDLHARAQEHLPKSLLESAPPPFSHELAVGI